MALAEEVRNALPKGYEIEGYRIDRVLGAGGFGVTYLATEISINRRVAIKEYLPSGIAVRGRDDV
jgi:serine/threonine protein kinase